MLQAADVSNVSYDAFNYRVASPVTRVVSSAMSVTSNRCELDSHADTFVAGSNTRIMYTTGKVVNVYGFTSGTKPVKDVPICTVGTVYTASSGARYLLVIHEAIHMGDKQQGSLVNPNQLRHHGLTVDECPRQFDANSTHSVYSPGSNVMIPLELDGVISYFETTKPTDDELVNLDKVYLTSDTDWDPYSKAFNEKELARTCATVERNEGEVVPLPPTQAEPDETSLPIEEKRESHDDLALYPIDFDFESLMEVHVRQVNTITSYINHVNVKENDLSGENLYDALVSCVRVAADDDDGDGLRGAVDSDVYGNESERRSVLRLQSTVQQSVLTPEILSRRWGIGLEKAEQTIGVTTHKGMLRSNMPHDRKVRQRFNQLKFPTIGGKWYTDTSYASVKSIRGMKCAQVWTNGKGYDVFHPIKAEKDAHMSLSRFIQDVGIPNLVISDDSQAQVAGEFGKIASLHHIKRMLTMPYQPWQNRAEASIKELKRATIRLMRKHRAPRRTWCYAGEAASRIRRLTANELCGGRAPEELVTGNTPDISEDSQFEFYEYVWYRDIQAFPDDQRKIGRCLGVADNYTSSMAYYILKDNGQVIVRKPVWPISKHELTELRVQAEIAILDKGINDKIGDQLENIDDDEFPDVPSDFFGDDELADEQQEPEASKPDVDDYTQYETDEYLSAEVNMPRDGDIATGRVARRKRNADGLPIGRRNANPMLDTREYEVEFPDGSIDTYTANLIAENLYSQIDTHGHQYQVVDEIIDHRSNGHAVSIDDAFINDKYGNQHRRKTTRGWELLIQWKGGTTSWVSLADIKDSHPVEVAEYAVANKIVEQPAFAWWAKQALRKRDRIIKKVKSRYWKRTHKFGIELPKSVNEAYAIDSRTGTDFWKRAIEREMLNVRAAFKFVDDDKMPEFWVPVGLHMIFDIKMDLTRKARLVGNGHETETPPETCYSSVVSRDSVRLAFLLAALNGLDILAGDVQNAYINADSKEQLYVKEAGPEFGPGFAGRPCMIVRALYGLKSSGARWHEHMAHTLRDMGYANCRADPDVWMKARAKPTGEEYWEYVLIYSDDILVLSHDPRSVMDDLTKAYTLKAGSIGPPTTYLGADIGQHVFHDSVDPSTTRWSMSSNTYLKRAVTDVENHLNDIGDTLRKQITPVASGYRPELDSSPLLNEKLTNYYQGLIGVLRWATELGRIDILTPVSFMSSYMAAPRSGHLEQLYHIFGYLKNYDRSKMIFDDTTPTFDESRFTKCDWAEFYPGAEDPLPPNMPQPRGKSVKVTCFVDADHAGCRVTRRSHTGVIIMVNRAPILWYSKRQDTVETSTFGSEYVALKTAVEMIEGLRYKLRMMGVPLDGPADVFCDNESVVTNTTKPESTLKKRHNAIAYHRCREAQAAGIVRIAHESGETNIADLFTKLLPGPRLRCLAAMVLW